MERARSILRKYTALTALVWLFAAPLLAVEVSLAVKQLETSLQTRLQDQVNSLFGDGSGIVVNVQVREGAPPSRVRKARPSQEIELGYLPVPMPQEETTEKKEEPKLSIQRVQVNLWVPEGTPEETIAGAQSLIRQTLAAYNPIIRLNVASVSWTDGMLKKLSVWKPYLPAIGAVLAALILAFGLAFMALVIRRSAHTIADRMPAIGGNGGGLEATVNIDNEGNPIGPGTVPRLQAPASSSSSAPPMATLRIQTLKLRTEILESLNPSTEATVLRHMNNLIASETTIERAVVLLELFGKDKGSEFFKRLPLQSRQQVVQFMKQGVMSRPKMELMLETGEELKTKVLVDSFDSLRGGASEDVAERILHISEAQLAEVFTKLAPEALARLYLYLEPSKISSVLAQIRKIDRNKFEMAVDMLPRMPEVSKADGLDATILNLLNEYVSKASSDVQSPFLKTYQEIIENAGGEVADEILSKLSSNARLDSYLSENIITAKTIFRLAPEVRQELVNGLSNKDLAALCLGLGDEERQILVAAAGERRRSLIAEEFDSLSHRGGKFAESAAQQAKANVIKRMKALKNEGTLAIVTSSENTGVTNTGVSSPGTPPSIHKKKGKAA